MKSKVVSIQKRIDTKKKEKDRMPLAECRKILNRNGNHFTDEEVIEINDFIFRLADIFIDHYEYPEIQQGKIIKLEDHKQPYHDESNYLCAG